MRRLGWENPSDELMHIHENFEVPSYLLGTRICYDIISFEIVKPVVRLQTHYRVSSDFWWVWWGQAW